MKQIVITFNDDTSQADIDWLATVITALFNNNGITAVLVSEDVEIPDEPKDICCYDEHGDIKVIGSTNEQT
jgi:ABC-type arginine transport system ATPase subunit